MFESKTTNAWTELAAKTLKGILMVQPSYGPGEFPPSEDKMGEIHAQVQKARRQLIEGALMEAYAEGKKDGHIHGQ